ncbi:hypothetical protein GCM10009678_75040 [Actinomadura kijaniata]|uniref:Uncharacterized protein n=1 Tax=Actinomadura namibiensis TaxID=182080 RepID=A0A7W3LYF5_ACTNM|nr:hypothetical protein [Actinomadura namibiensis]MBA8956659.1 hypothetical protein [Actinomadura namibiensis]
MPSSIPRPRPHTGQGLVRTRSLRALAVAARLERHHAPEGPPGADGRAEHRPARRTPDPA